MIFLKQILTELINSYFIFYSILGMFYNILMVNLNFKKYLVKNVVCKGRPGLLSVTFYIFCIL